ncbi:bifunctional 2-polyprenyl-6-hydroxyphenol methylase/3-demethylubiquinol 3-O-methyltransferase UbiG [Thalassobaculum sp.]|uniref:bifunctional 2-polyprenyl-6-hydroxyphenol methylase/3-demethylubiquinol 3-O-methyltransferase UbiG n=1 Tax=Thalassobaculum sp. TaxID=2022740 RepID=UPI0032EBDA4E
MLRSLLRRAARARSDGSAASDPNHAGPDGTAGTVDAADIDRFARLADRWWDPDGPHGPLHRFVPVRMQVIRDALAPLATDATGRRALGGLRVLDIGCGGGLLSEPMTRLGASVTGVDADGAGIAAATAHADEMGLKIDYRTGAAEDLAADGDRFDAVVASEVIEHVADKAAFVEALATLLKPGGVLVLTTINRTARSRAQAIVAAEYILRWVPRGTHDWNQFPKPAELTEMLEAVGFEVDPPIGMVFDPVDGTFSLSADARVNYALVARKTS